MIGSSLFIVGIIFAIYSSALAQLTEYETLKGVFTEILQTQVNQQDEDLEGAIAVNEEQVYAFLQQQCEGKETVSIPVDEDVGIGIMLPDIDEIQVDCAKLEEMSQEEISIEEQLMVVATKNIFDSFYFKQYDCEFIFCLTTGSPEVILTERGHRFFSDNIIMLWGVVAFGCALVIISCETWDERFKGLGWPLFIIGISYFLMGTINDTILGRMPLVEEAEQAGIDIKGTINKFIKPIVDSLLVVLVVGAVMVLIGYAIDYYQKKKEQALLGQGDALKKKS
jgi:hypothetical protein